MMHEGPRIRIAMDLDPFPQISWCLLSNLSRNSDGTAMYNLRITITFSIRIDWRHLLSKIEGTSSDFCVTHEY